jgi:hypothetical protein
VPSKVEGSRRGRLANLAATINNWEDDLSHPSSDEVKSVHSHFIPYYITIYDRMVVGFITTYTI